MGGSSIIEKVIRWIRAAYLPDGDARAGSIDPLSVLLLAPSGLADPNLIVKEPHVIYVW
jgi:hypothetical protein